MQLSTTTTKVKAVNLGRHKRNCTICKHPQREAIEAAFVAWNSPAGITAEYGLADRTSVYRHAKALGLYVKRQRNIRAALEHIIEQAANVEVTAPAVVSAIQAYAKINAQGVWVDRSEHLNMNELFERMTRDEMEKYAKDGVLPDWFRASVPATGIDGQEGRGKRDLRR